MSSVGSRGGPRPALTLDGAKELFAVWKFEEYGWLRARILWLAWKHREFHGDYLADVQLSQRNLVGASVNALVRQGFMASTGEHRRGTTEASHGRRSYVYCLTHNGLMLVHAMQTVMRDAPDLLPVRPADSHYETQEVLFG